MPSIHQRDRFRNTIAMPCKIRTTCFYVKRSSVLHAEVAASESEEKRTECGKQRDNPRGHPPVIQNAYSPLPGAASPSSRVISSRDIARLRRVPSLFAAISPPPRLLPSSLIIARHFLSLSARLPPRPSISVRRGAINKTFVTRRLWLTGT